MMLFRNALLGYPTDGEKKVAAWAACRTIAFEDPAVWRHDAHGRIIKWSEYSDRSSAYGWELDHFPVPAALGGTDDISNLRALHWKGNAIHGGLLGGALNALAT